MKFKIKKFSIIKSYIIIYVLLFMTYRLIKEPLLLIGVSDIFIKALLYFLLVFLTSIYIFYQDNLIKLNKIYGLNLFFLLYIFISFLFSKIEYGYSIFYFIYIFYDFYLIYFLTILLFIVINENNLRINCYNYIYFLKKIFFILFYVSLFIGLFQYLFNSSFMISQENWMYLTPQKNRIRISGLFYLHAGYAAFLTFTSCLSFYFILQKAGFSKKKNLFIFFSSILALFGTLAKTYMLIVIIFILSFLFYKILHKTLAKVFVKHLFIIHLLFSSLMFIIAFNIVGDLAYTREGFLYTNSILQRFHYWNIMYNEYFLNAELLNIFFGFSIPHTGSMKYLIDTVGKVFLTENLLLSIYMLNGIFGVLIFLFIQYKIWKFLLGTFKRYNDKVALFFVIYLPVWFYAGIFGRTIGYYSVYVLLPIFLYFIYYKLLIRTYKCKMK